MDPLYTVVELKLVCFESKSFYKFYSSKLQVKNIYEIGQMSNDGNLYACGENNDNRCLGARYLMGQNLKVVRAEFLTLR